MSICPRILLGLLVVAASVSSFSAAQAGDGWPPNGAWAYGSSPLYGFHSHRHTGGWHGNGWDRRGYGRFPYRSSHWGSYGHYRGSSLPLMALYGSWPRSRVAYHSTFRLAYPAVAWSASSYCPPRYYVPDYTADPLAYDAAYGTSCGVAFGFACAPYPAMGVPLDFSAPVQYSVHSSLHSSLPSPAVANRVSYMLSADVLSPGNSESVSGILPFFPASIEPVDSQLNDSGDGGVVLVSRNVGTSPLPEELLQAADDILQAGGFRESATAYAQLAVRFGGHDVLYGRRFVAQIASGDVEQAIVIASSAQLAGATIQRTDLPQESLLSLGLEADVVNDLSEALAKHAYQNSEVPEPLLALGYWLHLAEKDNLAEIFLLRAQQLTALPEVAREQGAGNIPTPSSKPELISLE